MGDGGIVGDGGFVLVGEGIVVVLGVGGLGVEVEVGKKYGGVGLVVRMWEGWRWGMWVGG